MYIFPRRTPTLIVQELSRFLQITPILQDHGRYLLVTLILQELARFSQMALILPDARSGRLSCKKTLQDLAR